MYHPIPQFWSTPGLTVRLLEWHLALELPSLRCRSLHQILVRGSPYLFSNFGAGILSQTKFSQIAFGAGILSKIGEGMCATVPIPAVAGASVLHSAVVGGSVAGDVGPL